MWVDSVRQPNAPPQYRYRSQDQADAQHKQYLKNLEDDLSNQLYLHSAPRIELRIVISKLETMEPIQFKSSAGNKQGINRSSEILLFLYIALLSGLEAQIATDKPPAGMNNF